jgi:hypothetical protein
VNRGIGHGDIRACETRYRKMAEGVTFRYAAFDVTNARNVSQIDWD